MAITRLRGGGQITDGTIPYADIQNVAANTILGNNTASATTIQEIALASSTLLGRGVTGNIAAITAGTGLAFSGSSIAVSANLASLSGLSYSSASFVKMTAAGTFALDTATYEPAITAGTTAQYWRGDKSWQTLNTAAVPESGNLYYTDARARAALSFTAGSGAYNSTTGVITIPTNTNQLTNGANFITTAQTYYIGTTQNALNRSSAAQSLTGVSIDGSAGSLASQGQYTNAAPGTTRGPAGLSLREVYTNGYPTSYGNLLHLYGAGAGQLLIGWSGTDGATENNYIRSKRDNDSGAWSSWAKIWTDQNLTNLNQLTNGPGYITSYTETDTLATVTARGASTSTSVTLSGGSNYFNGHHYFTSYDLNGNHYPHYLVGSNNNGSKLNLRMYGGNGSTLRLFYLDGNTGGFTWDGYTVWHSGNDGSTSGLDADLLDGNHASAFALINGNTGQSFGVFELSYALTAFNPSTAARTGLNSMSVKMWDNYFYSTGLGSDYGIVMDYYGRSGHVNTQVYFDAGGGTWYRTSPYNSGWGSWLQYITNFATWSIRVRGTDNAYANGLLQSGTGRADDATGDTWIFVDSAGSDSNKWGIKHNQADNRIEFWGNNSVGSYIQMNTGYYSGNAASANTANTAGKLYFTNISNVNTGRTDGYLEYYDVSGATGQPESGWNSYISVRHSNPANQYGFQFANPFGSDTLYWRGWDGSNPLGWRTVWHSGNLNVANWFGAITTGGTTNWNDVTNTRPGTGYTLLLGTHSNGPGPSDYFHAFNLEYSSKDGTGNVTQMAVSYGNPGNKLYMRGRYDGTWNSWNQFVTNSGTWGISISGNAATATYATSAGYATYLPTAYTSGQQTDPQVYFNYTVGLKVAMTGSWSVWSDTLWINGYSGGDVPNMCALHFLRNGTPRMAISTQQRQATAYGSYYEILSEYNYSSYALAITGGTMSGQIFGPSTGSDAYGGLIHIRERGYALATQDAWSYSPAITFHWGNRYGKRFGMRADGLFAVDDEPIALRSWVTSQGYITGYTETDTLATVTARGNSTTSDIFLNNASPTIYFQDTDHRSAMIHVNSNIFYVLRGSGTNSTTWTQTGGYWPLQLNLENNDALFGGNITAAGDVTAYSDVRLKENIVTVENALEKVTGLRGVTYNKKNTKDGKRHLGVIAQEVEEVLPEVVKEDEDGMKHVAYGNMVGVLIEAIKEQQTQIADLKKQIEYLAENR